MKFLVLGITGSRGAGKDTVALHLKKKYGFRILTFTDDVLAPVLKKRGEEVTRHNLIRLALELRDQRGKGVLAGMLSEKIGDSGFWAISGVRYAEEVEIFRKKFGDAFRLLEVRCETRKRFQRVKKRGTKGEGRMSFEEFLKVEEAETEKAVNETIELADYALDNNGSIGELKEQVDDLASGLGMER